MSEDENKTPFYKNGEKVMMLLIGIIIFFLIIRVLYSLFGSSESESSENMQEEISTSTTVALTVEELSDSQDLGERQQLIFDRLEFLKTDETSDASEILQIILFDISDSELDEVLDIVCDTFESSDFISPLLGSQEEILFRFVSANEFGEEEAFPAMVLWANAVRGSSCTPPPLEETEEEVPDPEFIENVLEETTTTLADN